MFKKVLLTMCLSACALWLPAAVSAAAPPDTAASPPDTAASVNGTPNGVWSTGALAKTNNSQVVSPLADILGCPSQYGCGWVNSGYAGHMGKWMGKNSNFTSFSEQQCQKDNWNDCISSIDNNGTSGCAINWWWNAGYVNPEWAEQPGSPHGSIGTSNDQFSSDSWC